MMSGNRSRWQRLHGKARFQPFYPHDAVVRFLMTQFPREARERRSLRVLDAGCGAGRHTVLLAEQGFRTYATDFSLPGLRTTAGRLAERGMDAFLAGATLRALPFHDDWFDGVIAFGVLYYNDWRGMRSGVDELLRVVKPGGKLHVVIRTDRDSRRAMGRSVDRRSVLMTRGRTNERGMVICFAGRGDVRSLFRKCSRVGVERLEFLAEDARLDSDWVITATK